MAQVNLLDMIPTPTQCRAARAMLNMTREELARRSGVSARAIGAFEKQESKLMRLNHEAIRQTFEAAGIEFLGTAGLRLDNREEK
jgi:transcriptional regulator with XRE-family HTH domain